MAISLEGPNNSISCLDVEIFSKMMKYLWNQNDENFGEQNDKIVLEPKWWKIFGTKVIKYFWEQNDEIFLGPKWWTIF